MRAVKLGRKRLAVGVRVVKSYDIEPFFTSGAFRFQHNFGGYLKTVIFLALFKSVFNRLGEMCGFIAVFVNCPENDTATFLGVTSRAVCRNVRENFFG